MTWEAFALAVPVGLLARAILVVNNVRDLDSDKRAGKSTLAVTRSRDPRVRTPPWSTARFSCARPLAVGVSVRWLLLPLVLLPWRPRWSRRARAHRRPVAEPGARAHRDAPARVLRAALRRAAAARMDVARHRSSPSRSVRPAFGSCAARAAAPAPARRRGVAAGARPRRWSLRRRLAGRCATPWRPTRRSCAPATATRRPTCSSAAASSPTCPRRSRRSTSRCGTWPATARASRSAR